MYVVGLKEFFHGLYLSIFQFIIIFYIAQGCKMSHIEMSHCDSLILFKSIKMFETVFDFVVQ
jgi:hypothetical protein